MANLFSWQWKEETQKGSDKLSYNNSSKRELIIFTPPMNHHFFQICLKLLTPNIKQVGRVHSNPREHSLLISKATTQLRLLFPLTYFVPTCPGYTPGSNLLYSKISMINHAIVQLKPNSPSSPQKKLPFWLTIHALCGPITSSPNITRNTCSLCLWSWHSSLLILNLAKLNCIHWNSSF